MKTMLGEVEQKLSANYDVYAMYYRDKSKDGRTPYMCRVWVFEKGTPLEHIKMVGAKQSVAKPLAVGESHCHPKDNFWKKKGRHMAVCRAAKALGVI